MYESIEIWCEHKRKLTKTNYASQSRHFKILSDVIDWKFGKLLHLLYSKYCIPMESVTKTVLLFWQQIFYFVRIIIRQHHVSSAWKKTKMKVTRKCHFIYMKEKLIFRGGTYWVYRIAVIALATNLVILITNVIKWFERNWINWNSSTFNLKNSKF